MKKVLLVGLISSGNLRHFTIDSFNLNQIPNLKVMEEWCPKDSNGVNIQW